ncbi:MAG: hypothetical protein ACJAXX_001787 [Roseivirga sp.]
MESYPALDKFKSDVQATIVGASNSVKKSFNNAVQSTGDFFSNIGGKISSTLKSMDDSKRFGSVGYVTDGSGGPGSNTNGEVIDRIYLTGVITLLSGGKKIGGGPPKITWEGGAVTADKVKKIIDMLEGDGDTKDAKETKKDSLKVFFVRNIQNADGTWRQQDTLRGDPEGFRFYSDSVSYFDGIEKSYGQKTQKDGNNNNDKK